MRKRNLYSKFKLKIFLILFIFLPLTFFYSCLYSIEKTKLNEDKIDSLLSEVRDLQGSLLYPDKELLKLIEAIILERKTDYKVAYNIYLKLVNSPYRIYAENRKNIIEKFYLTPFQTTPKKEKESEETKITKFEKTLLEFLFFDDIKDFFDNLYSFVFYSKENETIDPNVYLKNLGDSLKNIKANDIALQKATQLLSLSKEILKEDNLPYMTISKLYYYQFFFYLFLSFTDNDKALIQDINNGLLSSLYLSFENGGLYYYQILSFCLVDLICENTQFKNTLNLTSLNFTRINLSSYFPSIKKPFEEFSNLKKEKSDLRKTLKKTFSSSIFKNNGSNHFYLKKHLFLTNYFLENELFLEFLRGIFYLKDLALNYRIFNELLVDFYNFSDEYNKAIYYQWDSIFSNNFPLNPEKKISSYALLSIYPLWYIDIIKESVQNFKNQLQMELSGDSIFTDPFLYLSIINAESSFSNKIISSAGAIGLMQLLPSTAAWLRKEDALLTRPNLFDPFYNIETGFYYIIFLYRKFKGNLISVLGAYNGGHNAFMKLKTSSIHPLLVAELYPISETGIYIKKIIRNYIFYKFIYENKDWKSILQKIIYSSTKNF